MLTPGVVNAARTVGQIYRARTLNLGNAGQCWVRAAFTTPMVRARFIAPT
ncbi:MAG TPA: hypothetical protein VII61_12430 [Ktedonobacteraceae bacterium]